MEVALDNIVFDIALRQRARPVGAGVVGDVELAVEIEHRKHQIVDLDTSLFYTFNKIVNRRHRAGDDMDHRNRWPLQLLQ